MSGLGADLFCWLDDIKPRIMEIGDTFKTAFMGVTEALMAGELGLA